MSDFTEDIADGCLAGLFEVLPLRWTLGIIGVLVVIWLLIGHPGW